MPTFNFYSAWMDPVFYLWGLAAAGALFALVYSIRRYLELKNDSGFADEAAPVEEPAPDELPAEAPDLPAEQPELPTAEAPREGPAPAAAAVHAPAEGGNRAETFVRGIYEGISGLDGRLKTIESYLSKARVNSDFTVTFLEDIVQDFDNLDKTKIKARLEYLISDLKK